MKNCFTMDFLEQTILLRKQDVNFENGLGLVKIPCIIDGPYYQDLLFGVVDADYRPVISLFPYQQLEKISVLDANNIILKVQENYASNIYHVAINENEEVIWYYIPCADYRNIDNQLIRIKNYSEMYSIYDVYKKQAILPYFHYISDFEYDEEREELLALVVFLIPYDEEHFNQILTYINIKGEIVAPYHNTDQDIYYDQSMSLDEVVAIALDEMKGNKRR